jgi:histidine triad (HIT) family protein
MPDSIFTKIIKGELPAHKIYEDADIIAFLDIMPKTSGHLLVIPKKQIDKFYDLDDDTYTKLFTVVKTIAAHMEQVLGARTIMQVIGTDVPHAHVQLMPLDPDFDPTKEPARADDAELAAMAERLKLN